MISTFSHPDQIYTSFAPAYDQMVKHMPNWQAWISSVLPHVQGPRILDIACGTGYLLNQLTDYPEIYGLDLNAEMLAFARKNHPSLPLQRGDAHHLPYRAGMFDTVINTMAFNGYPDSLRALSEMHRVLRAGGRLLIVDVNPPADRNPVGMAFARKWETRLDPNLDMGALFGQVGFSVEDHVVGGFGSVHLYVAEKR
jgi:ubiquinone/menaquinone biosynthesis C-methylase UbiE